MRKWRRDTMGENVDSRHFGDDFEFSGLKSNCTPKRESSAWVFKWVLSGLVVTILTAAVIKQALLPALVALRGLLA